ncbi:MAG: hypothetical protein M1831_005453 [Alyxoria varia]|nr:MAG: hypothetical protein M1831_005453 [Alyxoria varia]
MTGSRTPFRLLQQLRTPLQFSSTHTRSSFARKAFQRRSQSTATANAETQSGFAKLWNSPVGPKTVHFWAPIMKWGLVLAGISDLARPAESLSLQQNLALTATGAIWTRWCFVIKPKNYFLATVNFFLFCVGSTQVTRVMMYRRSLEGKDVAEEVKDVAQKEAKGVKQAVEDPKGAVDRAKKT